MPFIDRPLVPARAVALGLFLGGAAIGGGVARMRTADRAVTVKGVAEREVRAALAIWPLRVVAASDADGLAWLRELRDGAETVRLPWVLMRAERTTD